MSKFALSAPPSSGKLSRREKVERSGRSTSSMTAEEIAALAISPGKSSSQQHAFPAIPEHSNPVAQRLPPAPAAARPAKASSPAPAQDFFNPQAFAAAPAPAPTANIFDFFDPLAAPAPAPVQQRAPPAQPQQQPPKAASHSQAVDPFSVSFTDPTFDPFEGAPPLEVRRQSMTGPPLPPKPQASKPAQPAVAEDGESSDSSSGSDSSDSSDESDDEEGPKNKARADKAVGQLKNGSKLPPSASHAADTHNPSIASGSSSASTSSVAIGSSGGLPMLKVDVLAYMKKGTPLLKYGRQGYPHFRQFQLSDDNTKVQWFSGNKKSSDTQIDIYEVEELRLGQTTANFSRHPAPDLEGSSFSLMYDHGRGSLDVIAKDPNEYKIWTRGLEELIKIANGGGRANQLETLKTLELDITVHRARRSSMDIVDVRTGQTASQMLGAAPEAQRPRAISTGNKAMHGNVSKQFANLKYKMNKRKEELRDQQYYMAPEYENMVAILKRVGDSVARVQDSFQDGDYAQADDEIWRAGVDLESLKNMMRAIKP